MKPHPLRDIIVAWVEGYTIQRSRKLIIEYTDKNAVPEEDREAASLPELHTYHFWRVKPEKKVWYRRDYLYKSSDTGEEVPSTMWEKGDFPPRTDRFENMVAFVKWVNYWQKVEL